MADLAFSTDRLILSTPRAEQAGAMLDFVSRNREHFKRWSPPDAPNRDSLAYWQDVVAKSDAAFQAGAAVRFWISPRVHSHRIIGNIGYSQIFRGPFCSCVLGYQIDRESEGQGMMSEALRATVQYMFAEQNLHRIAANDRPENVRSGRLLAKLGFRIEGYAKDYLFIDGAWRDHILTSITHGGFDAGGIRVA